MKKTSPNGVNVLFSLPSKDYLDVNHTSAAKLLYFATLVALLTPQCEVGQGQHSIKSPSRVHNFHEEFMPNAGTAPFSLDLQ